MKHLLLTTIAAVVLVGCGESQQSAPTPEAKPVEPVVEAAQTEPPTAKAPDISILYAAGTGNIEAVKQHVAAGTDVNAKNKYGRTPLHYAAGEGHKEIAELLIGEGADVNAKDRFGGETPLDVAIMKKEIEIGALLSSHGGKTGEELKAGEPFAEAATPERQARKIPERQARKVPDTIHRAAGNGNIEAVKKHLVDGADVNAKSSGGRTPLLGAAHRGHKEIVELLIAKGADVNAKDNNGGTPLHWAAQGGHKEIAELLIAKGADVNVKDKYGNTPLDRAIQQKHTETAALLRKHGGKTGKELPSLTLWEAARRGGIQEVKDFLANGADVNAKDKGGVTPLDWATGYRRTETADLLRKHGGKTGEELKAEGK